MGEKMMALRWLAQAVLIALLLVSCKSQEEPLNAEQMQANLDSFDYIWQTINDKHWDKEFGGLDWQAVRDELRPRLEQSSTMAEARGIMSELINRFEKSHYNLIPREAYEALDPKRGGGRGVTGIRARVQDGEALVVQVESESPAANAGVEPGWLIVNIGDDNMPEKLGIIAEKYQHKSWKDAIMASAVEGRLEGKIGPSKKITFLDGENNEVQLTLKLARKKGRPYKFGHLPNLHVWIEVDTLADDIG